MMAARYTVLDSLNDGLHRALGCNERVIIIGEDLLDPYGGAFKVTRGLSSAYPKQVLSSPISEAGIVGIAAGMALRGMLPVVEIMFGDFLTLAADQIINHISKFAWMYSGNKTEDEQVHVPLVIRTPMGGRRGYGPTHSQTLEKLFLGTPGLRVVAPCSLGLDEQSSPGGLLNQAIFQDLEPVLFVENKLLYLLGVQTRDLLSEWEISTGWTTDEPAYPIYTLRLAGAPDPQITLAAYGYMAELARQAQYNLAYQHEVFCELVIPTQLSPYQCAPLTVSVQRTGRLLTIEEGTLTLGWGAELVARFAETKNIHLKASGRLAALDLPIPAAGALEQVVLPGVEQIVEKCLDLIQTR